MTEGWVFLSLLASGTLGVATPMWAVFEVWPTGAKRRTVLMFVLSGLLWASFFYGLNTALRNQTVNWIMAGLAISAVLSLIYSLWKDFPRW